MVRALLEGRKTQTRRVIEPWEPAPLVGRGDKPATNHIMVKVPARHGGFMAGPTFNPRYAPGDRLWVKEKHAICDECGNYDPCEDANSAGINDRRCCRSCDEMLPKRKRPSIHMPRAASRLTLIVTDVRVQRLQEISGTDAIAEGIEPVESLDNQYVAFHARTSFEALWDSLNADRAPWDSNPWVCAVSFTVQRQNIDRAEATA
jgi:hypothetical protein